MRLELTGRHVDIPPALRRLLLTKLSKLERVLNHRALSAQVVLTREKHRHRADITLHARGEKFLHGVGDATNWEASITQAIGKLTQQAQRVKGKWERRKRDGDIKGMPAAEAAATTKTPRRREHVRMPRIVRASRQPLKPMSVADAARELDAGGDGVVVFRDLQTSAVNVLYRRVNGELTLLETEA